MSEEREDRYGCYRVRRLVARGGMGTVYEAEHVERGGIVALKVLERARGDEDLANRRFRREARILERVRHPNVVSILEAGFERGRPFLAMELLDGETLSAHLAHQGPLPVARVVELFAPITAAVAAIHDTRVLHRDLKLSNVLLARRGGAVDPVVLDFGISKAIEEDAGEAPLTRSEGLLGTPSYLSPEQTLNARAASPLSDEYSIGVMLYECLTGERPFGGVSPYEIMHAIVNAPLRSPSELRHDLPDGLEAVVLRALSRDPAARFGSVRALGSALLRFGDTKTAQRWAVELASGHSDGERTEVELPRSSVTPSRVADAWPPPPVETHTPRGRTLLALALAALGTLAFAALPHSPAPGRKPLASAAVARTPAAASLPVQLASGRLDPTLLPRAQRAPEGTVALPAPTASAAKTSSAPRKPPRLRVRATEAARSAEREQQPSAPTSPALARDAALDPFDAP